MHMTISQRYAQTEKVAVTAKTYRGNNSGVVKKNDQTPCLDVLDPTEFTTRDCRNANRGDDQQIKGCTADLETEARISMI